tara:strand:- start:375 stop:1700 length:1326 start_codon:yes stop_codon:yes gene_type:complete
MMKGDVAESCEQSSWTVSRWLEHLESLHSADIELGLDRVKAVASQLDCLRPAPCVVLVAGTNGKGTTTALLAALLRKQGLRVGCYTSPHIRRYNERVTLDGTEISDADLCRSFESVESARGSTALTYFEFGTLAALNWFKDQPLDVCILEIGLGGRLDAVNIVEADICIVTSVGLDHQAWLGDTREAIAREKYAIARSGKYLISGDPNPPASASETVEENGGIWIGSGEQFEWLPQEDSSVCSIRFKPQLDDPSSIQWDLPGAAVPYPNVATALQTLALMGHLLPEQEVIDVLSRLKVDGRMQRWQWLRNESEHVLVTLDVAHNEQAARYLKSRLQHVDGIVLAMLSDKPVEDVQSALPNAKQWVCAGLDCPRGLSSGQLQQRLTMAPEQVCTVVDSVAAGIEHIQSVAKANEHWLIVGSFFTVEAALKQIEAGGEAWKSI